MFDYNLLNTLATLVRDGSFERAAVSLGVSSSAVSQRIRLLEERMGQVLVVRDQPCRPTDIGRQLCRHVEHVQLLEQQAPELWRDLIAKEITTNNVSVQIAVNADSLATWFVPVLQAYAAETGHLLDITVDDQVHTLNRLERGEVLGAVTASGDVRPGCRAHILGRMPYIAVASGAFIEKHMSDGITATSISASPSIVFDRKDSLSQTWLTSVLGEVPNCDYHWIPSTHGILAATVAGLGWSMTPAPLVEEYKVREQLYELMPETDLHVDLFWQVSRASDDLLSDLTRHILGTARKGLLQEPDPQAE